MKGLGNVDSSRYPGEDRSLGTRYHCKHRRLTVIRGTRKNSRGGGPCVLGYDVTTSF